MKRNFCAVLFAGAILFSLVGLTEAGVLGFDDLENSKPVPNGYGDLNWSRITVVSDSHAGGAFSDCIVSPHNAVYTEVGHDDVMVTIPTGTFNFISAYLSGLWNNVSVEVTGYLDGEIIYSKIVDVSSRNPTQVYFNWHDIDKIKFPNLPGNNDVAIDDFEFNINKPTEVAIDIKPGSCPNPLNVKSKGKLPVAIMGTSDLDVNQIDLVSIRLQGVAPLRSGIEDVGYPYEPYLGKKDANDCLDWLTDGYPDLTLKFDKQKIVEAIETELGREVEDGEVIVLPLTGNLKEEFGGTEIKGEDVIIIIKKGKVK